MRCYHTIPPSRASCATISSRGRWLIANRALLHFELIPFAPHPHFCSYHMKLFHEEATQYYVKCTHLFHYEPAQCPALLLVSKTDPVGTEKANNRLRSIWESVGVKVSCVHPFRKMTYAYRLCLLYRRHRSSAGISHLTLATSTSIGTSISSCCSLTFVPSTCRCTIVRLSSNDPATSQL